MKLMTYKEYRNLEFLLKEAKRKGALKMACRLQEQIDNADILPEVGVPCSVHYYTDWCSGHISEVISPTKIRFVETGIYSGEAIYTKRKCGAWVKMGQKPGDGCRLHLGYITDYRCDDF